MEKEAVIKVPQGYQKVPPADRMSNEKKQKSFNFSWCFILSVASFCFYTVVSFWCLKSDVKILENKAAIFDMFMRENAEFVKNFGKVLNGQIEYLKSQQKERLQSLAKKIEETDDDDLFPVDKVYYWSPKMKSGEIGSGNESDEEDDEDEADDDDSIDQNDNEDDDDRDDSGPSFEKISMKDNQEYIEKKKKKREIRDYDSSVERDIKAISNETEEKSTPLKKMVTSKEKESSEKSSIESTSTEVSTQKKHSFIDRFSPSTYRMSRKSRVHKKHRKSSHRIGSAERFFTETHSTTSAPIQVRRSRTKATQVESADKNVLLTNQKFEQHTSPIRDTITKEEAILKGYRKYLDKENYELEASRERGPDTLEYNMITIHFSADTSHYSRERDPHYYGNGRMQIKSEVYKDWKPAHWTQGVRMSKYFNLNQGRVTVFTTGIYLIYAQIQYSNVQEVNGFGVFRNNEVVVQCITTSTHPDKQEIKSNTCGISTTILLQSNDTICIKDLHHGRYVVLTPEKSYFGLVLLSPFKNLT